MSRYLWLTLIAIQSCGDQDFSVSKIVNGNTIELSNGITVVLSNVAPEEGNVKILERYLKGKITLYDKDSSQIESFTTDRVVAIVYNSDGDCINELLAEIVEITDDKAAEIIEYSPTRPYTTIPFTHENGILKIPVEINQTPMFFIFDTGASLISISSAQAKRLIDAGKLTTEDFIGNEQFSDANGDISEGLIINLSTVMIGNRMLSNVQACVLQSQNAPLLFGQSALQKFGKVTIDYKMNQITFE